MQALQNMPAVAMTNCFNREGFDAMLGAYKTSGGMARADELALLLEEKRKGNFVSVARWIVSRDIFSFEWQSHIWVPLFQFDTRNMSVRQDVRRVTRELAPVLDNWTLAQWFTQPNAWLEGKRPVDLVEGQFSDVLYAARADRYVAAG